MAAFDYYDLFEAIFGAEATGGGAPVVTAALRPAGETDGQTARDAEVWGLGCVVYVPAPPNKDGVCQALASVVGGTKVVIATRDTRAAAAVGDLPPGAAAFCCPTGKNAAIFKPDGSISLLRQGKTADALVSIEKDGAILFRNEWGQVQLGPEGFAVMLTSGESFSLGPGVAQLAADHVALASGTVALGAAATAPLTFAPVSGVAKPAPNVFV